MRELDRDVNLRASIGLPDAVIAMARTARALLLDADSRLLLAMHDLTSRHIGQVIWVLPGGGVEAR